MPRAVYLHDSTAQYSCWDLRAPNTNIYDKARTFQIVHFILRGTRVIVISSSSCMQKRQDFINSKTYNV